LEKPFIFFILNNFYTQNFLQSVVWKPQNTSQKLGQLFSGGYNKHKQCHIGRDCPSPNTDIKLPICSNRVSDIIESFVVMPIKGGQYKMTLILQSLALIDRGFSLVSAPYINITSIQTSEYTMDREHQFMNPKHDESPGCKILTQTQAEEKSRLQIGGHKCYTSKKRTCHDEYWNDHRQHRWCIVDL